MLFSTSLPRVSPIRQTIRNHYRADEQEVIESLIPVAELDISARTRVRERARVLIEGIRQSSLGKGGIDALLNEFSLSTEEGVVLMCLAEALLRVPDKHTMDLLIQDKLSDGDWASHLGNSESLFVNASAWGLLITGKLVSYKSTDRASQQNLLKRTVGRLGEPVIRASVRYAMQIMGTQFVLGNTIDAALTRANKKESQGFRHSYDMLGEAARTEADAQRYLHSYHNAIEAIGSAANNRGPIESPGISVKLSAIHPRYEFTHRQRVFDELLPRLKSLVSAAKKYNIGFTVDAEEADRLDLSLDLIEAVFSDPELDGWEGFGIAVQAYQKRALPVIDWAQQLAEKTGRKLMVRLVKGAYWDTEIKLAQAEGYTDYPVFTSKQATDVSYQACARRLLEFRDHIYPQFATHNAYSVASILQMAAEIDQAGQLKKGGYEFQRLHGMGEALYEQVLDREAIACRIYAPVGEHSDLLAYLVRRLLENGANSSFVNNIVDESVDIETLLIDPVETVKGWHCKRNTAIVKPVALYGSERKNSVGLDLSDTEELRDLDQSLQRWWQSLQEEVSERKDANAEQKGHEVLNPANQSEQLGFVRTQTEQDLDAMLSQATAAASSWAKTDYRDRAQCLIKLAETMENRRIELIGLCIKEAGKTLGDAVAEVREAVDFCRYYGLQAQTTLAKNNAQARGVILCISPWNFPLAIFIGQVTAALAAGNTVLAKSAEQTSLIACKAVEMAIESGIPAEAIHLINAPGRRVGAQLVPDQRVNGIMFTGSTDTGKILQKTLAERPDVGVPLIAETGGQNAMIVDSTALPEQVVDDVLASGFQSAGQRCSALRVLFIQEDVADKIITMIQGGMAELRVGDPAHLHTDVGPVIDEKAHRGLCQHIELMAEHEKAGQAKLIYRCQMSDAAQHGHFFAPTLYEINNLGLLKEEVFGPVVHIIRYPSGGLDQVIEQIDASGFGLTLGIHSRIHKVKNYIAERVGVGNIYVNRNMIGAVVGVQPFGGQGLSGTGPKAGGPVYLTRLTQPVGLQLQPEFEVDKTSALNSRVFEESDDWSALDVEQRAQKLGVFLDTARQLAEKQLSVDPHSIQQAYKSCKTLIQQARSLLLAPQTLPGPTGESNQLLFESRGRLANWVNEFDFLPRLTELTAALVTGNSLINLCSANCKEQFDKLQIWLQRAGIPASAFENQIADDITQWPLTDAIEGVMVAPDSVERLNKTEQYIAQREGKIIPLISENPGNFYLYRFLLEKTITEDTTASGGNASLLTLTAQHDEPTLLEQTG